MLKYKINTNARVDTSLLGVSELYVANDLSYISGVTDYFSGIKNGDYVQVVSPDGMCNDILKVESHNVQRQGYVLVNEEYTINFAYDYSGITIENEEVSTGVYRKYVLYKGSKIYENDDSKSFTINDENIYFGDLDSNIYVLVEARYINYGGVYYYLFDNGYASGFMIDGTFYEAKSTDTIRIPTKHWIEDGILSVKGIDYVVDTDLVESTLYPEGYEPPSIKMHVYDNAITSLDGDGKFLISDYQYDKWFNVTKFIIYTNNNGNLVVDDAKIGYYHPYIEYGDNTYYIDNVQNNYEYTDNDGMPAYKVAYSGFGVVINNTFHKAQEFYSEDTPIPTVYDRTDDLTVNIDGDDVKVLYSYRLSNNGNYLTLFAADDNNGIVGGDKIVAKSDGKSYLLPVNDLETKPFVTFNGNIHYVSANLCDTIDFYGTEYDILYSNGNMGECTVLINGEYISFDIFTTDNGKYATYKYDIKTLVDSEKKLVEYTNQSNSSYVSAFTINEYSGVTIDGQKYRVYSNTPSDDYSDDVTDSIKEDVWVYVYGSKRYEMIVKSVDGLGTIICDPVIDFDYNGIPMSVRNEARHNICTDICSNLSSFSFSVVKNVLGDEEITPEKGVIQSILSDKPLSSLSLYDDYGDTEIRKINNYYVIPVKLSNTKQIDLTHEILVNGQFVSDVIDDSVNDYVDMEKDVYYPAYYDGSKYNDISEIRLNFHFRTRGESDWKINKNDSMKVGVSSSVSFEGTTTEELVTGDTIYNGSIVKSVSDKDSNWFVTDYYDYDNLSAEGKIKLQEASDLLGFINFDESDVKYQKSRLSKSFVRLSFYSTNNVQDQMLLATSTVFINEHEIFNKRMKYDDSEYRFDNVCKEFTEESGIVSSHTIGVYSEIYDDEISGISESFDDETRLSSRITIKNKYESDTSSEGFYLYMFKEYSNKLKPATIYLKVDFYHAGVGKVFPMMIPMVNIDDSLYRPALLSNYWDVEDMKKGVSLSDVNRQLFIPINIVYDDEKKRYVYYLPDNYRENQITEIDDNIMELNLFELKIRNESYENNY